jgi:putative hydrolase of the HAD superfamily
VSDEIQSEGIKAVIFDFGGVISFPPSPELREAMAALAGIDTGLLASLEERYRGEYDRGVLSGSEYYLSILTHAGREPDGEKAERLAQMDLQSWTRINPETVRLMADIRAAGLKVGILSNMGHEFLALARRTIPLFKEPYLGLFSCELKLIKPEDAIYEALVAALDCPPYAIVFVDDIRSNIEAARILGINAFLWKDAAAARELLKKLEIPL